MHVKFLVFNSHPSDTLVKLSNFRTFELSNFRTFVVSMQALFETAIDYSLKTDLITTKLYIYPHCRLNEKFVGIVDKVHQKLLDDILFMEYNCCSLKVKIILKNVQNCPILSVDFADTNACRWTLCDISIL